MVWLIYQCTQHIRHQSKPMGMRLDLRLTPTTYGRMTLYRHRLARQFQPI